MRKAIIEDIFHVRDVCDYVLVKCGSLVELAGVKVIKLISHNIDGVYVSVCRSLGSRHLVPLSDVRLVWR